MRIIHGSLTALSVLGLLAACGDGADLGPTGDDPVPPPTSVDAPPESSLRDVLQGSWTLVTATGLGGDVRVLADWPVTVTFDGDQAGGRAACNSYGGTATIGDDGSIAFGEISSTAMGCEPEVMALEQAFLDALMGASAVETAEQPDRFVLVSGGTRWTFERQQPVPDAELEGTRWVLDTYLDAETASTMPFMELAFVEFGADGTLNGSTSCRRLEGEWLLHGNTLQIPRFAAVDDPTAGACAPESEQLDGLMIGVMESGVAVDVDGGRLTLLAPGGEGLSFVAADGSGGEQALDGGVDGPVMYARRTEPGGAMMAAEVRGLLELDGDCLYVVLDGIRYPVLWPFGTTWDSAGESVVLPDGAVVPVGGELSGGGGYVDDVGSFTASEAVLDRAAVCAQDPYFEIAVLQGS